MIFKNLILFFYGIILTVDLLYSQNDSSASTKRYALGINSSVPVIIGAYIPGIPLSPNVYFDINRHRIFAGVDIYSFKRNIYGAQAGYQYLFTKEDFYKSHLYLESNLQYIAYYETPAMPQNIFKDQYYDSGYPMLLLKSRTLINTIGIGYKLNFIKLLSLNFLLGYGINWNHAEYLTNMRIWKREEGDLFNDHFLIKVGIGINIWKK